MSVIIGVKDNKGGAVKGASQLQETKKKGKKDAT